MIAIGTAGNIEKNTALSFKKLNELGLNAQEIEFVRQVYMKPDQAKEFGKIAKDNNISLSIHASYYVNLASLDPQKIEDSKKRILAACEIAHYLNAGYVVFHAGFYQGRDKEEVYEIIKKEVIELQSILKKNKWNTNLAPETTGKKSQFGDIDELLRLSKDTGCKLCIDFAHIEARENELVDYDILFDKLKQYKHIHAHFSGIEYTEKGERKHLITPKDKIKRLINAIKKHNVDITIINESPDTLGDSLKTKEIVETL